MVVDLMNLEDSIDLVVKHANHIRIEDDMSKSTGKTEDVKQRSGAAKLRGKPTSDDSEDERGTVIVGDDDYERSANATDEIAANPPGFLNRVSDGKEVGRPYLVVETQNFNEDGSPVMEGDAEVWTEKLYPPAITSDFRKVTIPDLLADDELDKDKIAEGLYTLRFHDEVEEIMDDSIAGWWNVRNSGASTLEELSHWIPNENTRRFLVKEYNNLSNLLAEYKRLERLEQQLSSAISSYQNLENEPVKSNINVRRTQILDPALQELRKDILKGPTIEEQRDKLYNKISELEKQVAKKRKDLGIVRHVDKEEKWPLIEEQVDALENYLRGNFFNSPFQGKRTSKLLFMPNEPSRFREFKDQINSDTTYYEKHKDSNLLLQNILYAPENPEDENAVAGFNATYIIEDNPFDLDKNPRLREIRYKGADLIVMPITHRAAVAERARGTLTSLLNADYVGKNKLFIFPNQYPVAMTQDEKFLMDVGNRALFGDKVAEESKNDVYFPDAKVRKFDKLFDRADTTPIIVYHFKHLWALGDALDHIVESTGEEPEYITDEEIERVSRERNYFEYDQKIGTQNIQVGSGEDARVEKRDITIKAPGARIAIYHHGDLLNSMIVSQDELYKFDQEVGKVVGNRLNRSMQNE